MSDNPHAAFEMAYSYGDGLGMYGEYYGLAQKLAAMTARAEAAEVERDAWRSAAHEIGERIDEAFGVPAPGGPKSYYSMTANEWREWARGQLSALRAQLDAAQWRPLDPTPR